MIYTNVSIPKSSGVLTLPFNVTIYKGLNALGLVSTTTIHSAFQIYDIHFDLIEELSSGFVVVSNCTGGTTGATSTTGSTETTSGTGTTTASTTFAGTTSKPSDITDVSYAIRQNPAIVVFVIAIVFMIFM